MSSATRKHVNEDQGNMLQQKWENKCLYSQTQSNTMYNEPTRSQPQKGDSARL
jgi:hypothetical protein